MKINDKSGHVPYVTNPNRYDAMTYKRCGKSGVLLPAISLGLWHNFGYVDRLQTARKTLHTAFDLGITHFDLANNYGPPYGSAEENFGTIFQHDFKPYRDELFVATKAGFDMWPGPYGNLGSRKHLMASIDQSLQRLQLDYVDIFYHHRHDPDAPLEETIGALADIVKQGKALYIGISNYPTEIANQAALLLKELRVPFILNQSKYSLFERSVENGLLDTLQKHALGCIVFSPLAQGMLTDKYLDGIPEGSRAATDSSYLEKQEVYDRLDQIKDLAVIAADRGQKLSQMAIAWLLQKAEITSVLIGASSAEQLKENVTALDNLKFTKEELTLIENVISRAH